jgi:hypothetical protein
MAAFDLSEELRRPVEQPQSFADSVTLQPKQANLADGQPTPPVIACWPRGEVLDRATAVDLAVRCHKYGNDRALGEAMITGLAWDRWLHWTTTSLDALVRPETDPPAPASTGGAPKPNPAYRWQPGFTRRKRVQLPSGEFVEAFEEVEESYVDHLTGEPVTADMFHHPR